MSSGGMKKCLFLLLLLLFLLPVPCTQAAEVPGAKAYYDTYGNRAVFFPVDDREGEILFCTGANLSDAGTKYKLIGWKMTFTDDSGQELQTMYFTRNGGSIGIRSVENENGAEYKLYAIMLSSVEARLAERTDQALEHGSCRMQLDACMVIIRNGTESGVMNDRGESSGEVYTDYNSITRAVNWSKSGREALRNYFGKSVEGMFFTVDLEKEDGIAAVEGGGSYCYGRTAEISAICEPGAEFLGWSGTIRERLQQFTVRIDRNLKLTAKAHLNQPPVILADRIYLAENDLESMETAENEIRRWIYAEDPEDGILEVRFPEDWERYYEKLLAEQEAELPVWTCDSENRKAEEVVRISVVSTKTKNKQELKGKLRFISAGYFEDEDGKLIKTEFGGLREDSIWAADPSYRQLLKRIFN